MPALISTARPTGRERLLTEHELIVSKTDLAGRITYANRTFQRIADFTEAELIGAPHSLVRHPDMPRAIFKLLWDEIRAGHEVFAYVVNLTKHGDHYWVLAHVTPTFDSADHITGFHSNRRMPDRESVERARALYAQLSAEESRNSNPSRAAEAGLAKLHELLKQRGLTYEQFFFTI